MVVARRCYFNFQRDQISWDQVVVPRKCKLHFGASEKPWILSNPDLKWNSIELYLGFHLFGRIKEVLSVRFTNFGLHNNETEGLKAIGQDDGCDVEGVGVEMERGLGRGGQGRWGWLAGLEKRDEIFIIIFKFIF
ncbi:unnamed protein product [Prunus armeniaca]